MNNIDDEYSKLIDFIIDKNFHYSFMDFYSGMRDTAARVIFYYEMSSYYDGQTLFFHDPKRNDRNYGEHTHILNHYPNSIGYDTKDSGLFARAFSRCSTYTITGHKGVTVVCELTYSNKSFRDLLAVLNAIDVEGFRYKLELYPYDLVSSIGKISTWYSCEFSGCDEPTVDIQILSNIQMSDAYIDIIRDSGVDFVNSGLSSDLNAVTFANVKLFDAASIRMIEGFQALSICYTKEQIAETGFHIAVMLPYIPIEEQTQKLVNILGGTFRYGSVIERTQ